MCGHSEEVPCLCPCSPLLNPLTNEHDHVGGLDVGRLGGPVSPYKLLMVAKLCSCSHREGYNTPLE